MTTTDLSLSLRMTTTDISLSLRMTTSDISLSCTYKVQQNHLNNTTEQNNTYFFQLPLPYPVADCSCMLSYGYDGGKLTFSTESSYLNSTGNIKTVQAYFHEDVLAG